ncbi:hypothetical protein LINPERHAP1_LOCUS16868 [Linum perenne]
MCVHFFRWHDPELRQLEYKDVILQLQDEEQKGYGKVNSLYGMIRMKGNRDGGQLRNTLVLYLHFLLCEVNCVKQADFYCRWSLIHFRNEMKFQIYQRLIFVKCSTIEDNK